MDMQDKIEKYILNRLTESERADFEIEMHQNPLLKDQVELEQTIVTQIRRRAFVDQQIKQAREEMRQDKIERYLLDQMDLNEKAEFENELENNPLLKEQLELEEAIVTQIRNRAFVDQQISAAKKEMQKGKTIRLTLYTVVSLAAMLVLVFVVHGVWQGQQYNQLYASNFVTYTNDYLQTDGVTRGETTIDSLQVLAMTTYENQNFTEAETQLDQILAKNENPELRFYLAVSQLQNGKTELAQQTLETLYVQTPDYRYYEQTRWYLALVHLKLHHKTEAKKYLDELVKLEGVYWDKAKELLKKL